MFPAEARAGPVVIGIRVTGGWRSCWSHFFGSDTVDGQKPALAIIRNIP